VVYSVVFVEAYDYNFCLTAFCGTYNTRAGAEARCAQLTADNAVFKQRRMFDVCVSAGELHVFASHTDSDVLEVAGEERNEAKSDIQ
jgi:hypothetical protein